MSESGTHPHIDRLGDHHREWQSLPHVGWDPGPPDNDLVETHALWGLEDSVVVLAVEPQW